MIMVEEQFNGNKLRDTVVRLNKLYSSHVGLSKSSIYMLRYDYTSNTVLWLDSIHPLPLKDGLAALAHAYSQFFFDEVPLTALQYKMMLDNAAKYRVKPLKDLVAAMKRLKEEWRSTECDALVAECERLLGEAPDGSVMVLNPYIRGKILYACGFHTPKFQEARSIVSGFYNGQIEVPKYGLNDEPLWYDEVF